ncbi:divalent-cation tolerance protein CutA [Pseudoxanthomonas daejeonensis]
MREARASGIAQRPGTLPVMPVHLVFCSCPDPDTAQRLATTLVEARLAACVSVLPPMRSVYRWQGVVEQADEVLLLAKTPAEQLPALVERLRELHPYELPEIVAVEAAAGLPAYLDWVADATRE